MNLEILDTNFVSKSIIDVYTSLIWTDRYSAYGDFEIYTTMNTKLLDIFKQDYYLVSDDSEHAMIIENLKIQSDAESGVFLTVTGRSLESILDRRIIWTQTNLSGNLQNAIYRLLAENVMYPSIPNRQIPNFVFDTSTDPNVSGLSITDLQFTGDNLYEAIQKICNTYNIGFKVTLNSANQFVFKLYAGSDRSYNQSSLPYVVFSPNFENLINSDYDEKREGYKNITLVAGEGEGIERRTYVVGDGTVTGLSRRELYTDARDISSSVDGGELTPEQYNAALAARGQEKLAEVEVEKTYEAKVEPTQMYRYGEHYWMGDLCQLENEFGMENRVRVVEFIHSESSSGLEQYPTFEVVDV